MNIHVRVPDQYNAPPSQQYHEEQELCGDIADPTNTLERKQLISLLKQRYGGDIDSTPSTTSKHQPITTSNDGDGAKGRKVRQHCERVLVHATPVVQKNAREDNRELYHHGGVHHSPAALNGSWDRFSGTGSEGSDDSLPMQRRHVPHGKVMSSQHTIMRRSDSEDASDGSKNGSCERLMQVPIVSSVSQSKGVAFLQYLDDVKRVKLPSTVTSIDTVQALFATSFTDRVRMQDFEDGLKVVYIKDPDTGTYYMLEDISDVVNHCFMKIHEKSPSWKSSNTSQLNRPDSYAGSDGVLRSRTHSKNSSIGELSTNDSTVYVAPNKVNDGHQTDRFHLGYDVNQDTFQQPIAPKQNNFLGGHMNNGAKAITHQPHSQNVTNKDVPSYEVPQSAAPYPGTINGDVVAAVDYSGPVQNEPISHSGTGNGTHNGVDVETDHYTSNGSITQTGTVEDQLDDLSELLKTAIVEVKQDRHPRNVIPYYPVHGQNQDNGNRTPRAPGKLNPNLVQTIKRETENVAIKNTTLPSHFKPTIMVAAQQRSTHGSNNDNMPPPVPPKPAENYAAKIQAPSETESNSQKQATLVYPRKHHEYEAIDDFPFNEVGSAKETPGSVNHAAPEQVQKQQETYYNLPNTGGAASTVIYERIQPNKSMETAESLKSTTTGECENKGALEEKTANEGGRVDQNLEINDDNKESSGEVTCRQEEFSAMSDNLMDQIMNMELEVLQRSNSSIVQPTEPMPSMNEMNSESSVDMPNKIDKPYINPYTEIDDPVIADAFDGVPSAAQDEVDKCDVSDADLMNSSNSDLEKSSMRHVYAKISKITALPESEGEAGAGDMNYVQQGSNPQGGTGEMAIHRGSVAAPDFNELEDTAQCVFSSLKQLRANLSDLRKSHTDGVRSFKADIQKKLLEFRKKASRVDEGLQQRLDVNNKMMFEDKHPVRERRHRLTTDQHSYEKKISDTETNLGYLEVEMENVRLSVIEKKFVDDPEKLGKLHVELTQVTRGLAEVKNRFHGLHDMLNVVIADELKIISGEEKFIEDEPHKLDGLIKRCKNLSGTLFTLERLAAVQSEQGDGAQSQKQKKEEQIHDQLQDPSPASTPPRPERTSRHSGNGSSSAANYNYNQCTPFNDAFDIETLKGKRNVRFKQKP